MKDIIRNSLLANKISKPNIMGIRLGNDLALVQEKEQNEVEARKDNVELNAISTIVLTD